ncbi:hypothetical protein SODALDRAFT_153648 [Sodiomyces alkalinus F11]|uniref:C2H2 type master regulator of conidiophore development brlA n=1 Tax=Sodiomyces alkalinus (strain CBS 110278 / VKM F-3762 / F11) TaxID=1314773 RepID=A0A3N2PXV6_SODAK|nr:hypothetical protein SODALDRAFT_153648 [Sodiomyces alkalinus F11]ROT39175.1 hypothetical protein SODALDRAFT_153648 [Sodiomyces alkalinus F11]
MTPPPPAGHHWAPWPQQQHPGYSMMVGLTYSHYDSRAVTSAPIIPSAMAPHYLATAAYEIPPMKPAHFTPPHQYSYPPYELPALSAAPPCRTIVDPSQDRHSLGLQAAPEQPPQEPRQYSPSSRKEPLPPPTVPHPMHTKDIVYNKPIKTEGVDFSTPVDVMMKALQKTNARDTIAVAIPSPSSESSSVKAEPISLPYSDPKINNTRTGPEKPKRFHCPFDGCNKSFTQSTHLETHKRAHTGEKPYLCSWPGCERRFSQPGNLKTHYRLHTGERPFQCERCDSRFAQRGNLRAHMSTHSNEKPFLCKLEDCTKTFTTRGNLKNHQNKYHKETISRLIDWIASVEDHSSLSEDERELLWYFSNIYKNSNKGIKGRGRGRRVSKVRMGKGRMAAAIEMHKSNALCSSLTRLGFA